MPLLYCVRTRWGGERVLVWEEVHVAGACDRVRVQCCRFCAKGAAGWAAACEGQGRKVPRSSACRAGRPCWWQRAGWGGAGCGHQPPSCVSVRTCVRARLHDMRAYVYGNAPAASPPPCPRGGGPPSLPPAPRQLARPRSVRRHRPWRAWSQPAGSGAGVRAPLPLLLLPPLPCWSAALPRACGERQTSSHENKNGDQSGRAL